MISLWNRPGVTYALGGHGIGFPWHSPNGIDAAVATIEGACLDDGFTPASDVVFVMEEAESEQFNQIVRALSTCGINFPGDFEQAAALSLPASGLNEGTAEDATFDVYISSR